MAPRFFSESRALYLQKRVMTDVPNVHKFSSTVLYGFCVQVPGARWAEFQLTDALWAGLHGDLYILARDLQTMFNQTLQYNFKIVLMC